MKTTKTQYFLWKRIGSDDVVMYAPLDATSESTPYYEKMNSSSSFGKCTSKSLTALENALKRHSYHFICKLLIPSDHTSEDLIEYYTTIKKKFSL